MYLFSWAGTILENVRIISFTKVVISDFFCWKEQDNYVIRCVYTCMTVYADFTLFQFSI